MHRQTKFTSIGEGTKRMAYMRDGERCIICGAPGAPWCHVVPRSAGGMGIEQNIVTLCGKCHYSLDEGLYIKDRLEKLGLDSQEKVREYVEDYMRSMYPGWTREGVKYHKYGEVHDD